MLKTREKTWRAKTVFGESDNKEMVVGVFVYQGAVWAAVRDWSTSGVDVLTFLELSACWDAGTGRLQV